MEDLSLFRSYSGNEDKFKHLWIKGASLFIPQINMLLNHTNLLFNIQNIEDFYDDSCIIFRDIFVKYGSDKTSIHNYHIIYNFILNKLGVNSKLNILEIGIGTNNPDLISTMGDEGKPGASLYAFREYLPNSMIYGADIDTNILFISEKIKTFYVDQLDFKTFDNIPDIKYDLIIDDGLHSLGANFNTLLFALDHLNNNGWIVIEDIGIIDNWKSIDYILQSTNKFKTYIIKSRYLYMYIINKL